MKGTTITTRFSPVSPSEIEIIAVPDGEAPDWVRNEWVGLKLPLATEEMYDGDVAGVVSGPRTQFSWWLRRMFARKQVMQGYLVNALTAVEILDGKSPSAASWWRDNTPNLLDGKQSIVFETQVSRRLKNDPPDAAND